VIAFNASKSIKTTLLEYTGDFDVNVFDEVLTRNDIAHVFQSDIYIMIEKLSKEFPDIVKSRSIGKTWQDRDIMVLELDARDMMEKKGYKLSAVNQTKMSLAQKAKQEDVNKLSSEELMEHNEDIRTGAEKEQK
jgi:galactitol-specific phosphotransferase system IIB component|tara:strand:+ start:346 stop:747 length:402 start_codon:yes stop_codon:yes gene_type:complete